MIDDIMTFIIGLAILLLILLVALALVFAVLDIDKYDIMDWLNKKGENK